MVTVIISSWINHFYSYLVLVLVLYIILVTAIIVSFT